MVIEVESNYISIGYIHATPTEAIAEVRRKVHGVVPAFDSALMVVSDIVALMANMRISEEFEGVDGSGREVAAGRWLAAEEDVEAIGATEVMVLGEDSDDE